MKKGDNKGFSRSEPITFLLRAEHTTPRQNGAEQPHGFGILTHGPCVSTSRSCSQASPDVAALTEALHI